MAQAREIKDLECDQQFALAAAQVVELRAGELFELERIGYAAEPALTGFDESIFNAAG